MLDESGVRNSIKSIEHFIRSAVEDSSRSGVAVGLSGGLDSTVTAALGAAAIGPERVMSFFLPEREGPDEDAEDARRVAEWLHIDLVERDVTNALDDLGVYDLVLSKLPGDLLRKALVRVVYGLRGLLPGADPFIDAQEGRAVAPIAGATAGFKARHRMRMVYLFFEAERRGLLVAGTANRTERLTGIYTRFGIDDCAHLMPIGSLYRTDVLAVARALGVPEEISSKPPSPGIIPGVTDKYDYLLGLTSDVLDSVLEAVVRGEEPAAAARRLSVEPKTVARVAQLVRHAAGLRDLPLMPPSDD
jgi:NAD+ synthase